MGHSPSAIQKGDLSEAIAKVLFINEGYTILTADTHETHWDLVITRGSEFIRVQVKSCVESKFEKGKGNTLVRIRNKRGQNNSYLEEDYDLLIGVWKEGGKAFLFDSRNVNSKDMGETITVARLDGKPLTRTKAPVPKKVYEFSLPNQGETSGRRS